MARTRQRVLTIIAAGVLGGLVAAPVRASTYTFEALNTGNLAGQDNWTSYSGVGVIVTPSGAGNPSSRAFTASGATNNESFGSRENFGGFNIPTFTGGETAAVMEFDFRLNPAGPNQATFGLGHDVDNDGSIEAGAGLDEVNPTMGGEFIATPKFFVLREGATSPTYDNFPAGFAVGDWVRMTMVMDLTANGGDGAGFVFARNLTTGGALTAIAGLQNLNLHLTDGPAPTLWDAVYIESYGGDDNGGESDNITVLVPEPASMALLGVGGLLLARRRRA